MTSEAALTEWLGSAVAWALYGLPIAAAVGLRLRRRARADARGSHALAEARAAKLAEPSSLHPVINPNRCLGCATCLAACPEDEVLGLVDGKAALVNPTHCIGHGACRDACPTDAITLVLGSETQGVEIPRLDKDFQTSVPGLFVAGELGGMALIRNAVSQGRQAIESIARLPRAAASAYDVIIVGAGPAGIAASLAAKQHRLRALTLEQESLGGTVAHYPRGKIVMTAPMDLPLYGRVQVRETTKEALLQLWTQVVQKTGLAIRTEERVTGVARQGDLFEVSTVRGTHRAHAVVLALGRRGSPMKLGVPGEDLPKVVYRLVDPEQYRGRRVLVVGGGDSAIEAALAIADQPGASVALSYRGESFARAKPKNREGVEAARRSGRIDVRYGSQVVEIGAKEVTLRAGDDASRLPNDQVIVCAGGVLPSEFLRKAGVHLETLHGTPMH
jgi:thioredoxin reductase/Pyruvate/2-oxoacid:ferredoxin oxidoreductase delta subunit